MRRLVLALALVALLPLAALAQVGGAPGVTNPPGTFTGPVSGTSFTTTGLGPCASASLAAPSTTGVPAFTFTGKTTSGLCYDSLATYEGPALLAQGRVVVRAGKFGVNLYGFNAGGTIAGLNFDTSSSGPTLYGPDANAAYAPGPVASFGYNSTGNAFVAGSGIYGAETLGARGALAFQGQTSDANITYLYPTDPTGSRLIRLPDFSGTLLISTTANEPDTSNSLWVNTGELKFEGATANAFETTVGVIDPTAANVINFPDASGTIALTSGVPNLAGYVGNLNLSNTSGNSGYDITATPANGVLVDATDANSSYSSLNVYGLGLLLSGYADPSTQVLGFPAVNGLSSLISGGYALGIGAATAPAGTPTTVKVTTTDSAIPFTAGSVQVCGYATSVIASASGPKVCENIDFSAGPAAITTAQTYYTITNVKSSGFNNLAGGGTETIKAEWTDVGNTAITDPLTPDLVNHTASDPGADALLAVTNFVPIKCLDLQGCVLTMYGNGVNAGWQSGRFVTLYVMPASTAFTIGDAATQKVSASLTLTAYSTITLLFDLSSSLWVEMSHSIN